MPNLFGYTPSAFGREFHALTTDEAHAGGSAGPGKSLILLMDALPQIVVEHNRCLKGEVPWGSSMGWALHLRRLFPALAETISRSKRIFPSIDPRAKYDEQNHLWTFASGYKYQFGHCKDPDSWRNYYSNSYTHIAFDELPEFTKEQYDNIRGRCRSSDPVLAKMLKVRSASNPAAGWVREYYVDPAPDGRVILRRTNVENGVELVRTRIFIPAKLDDNPDKSFVVQYRSTLRDLPAHLYRALLHGDWYSVPGAFFAAEWDPTVHVVKPFQIPSAWPQFRSLDWGYKLFGVVLWWAVDPDGTLLVTRELQFRYQTVRQVAARIKEIERGLGLWDDMRDRSRLTGPADTQLWETRGDEAISKAAEMDRAGVPWVHANKSSRADNAQRVISLLKGDAKGGVAKPGLVFFANCHLCRRIIPALGTDKDNPEAPAKIDGDDAYDAVAYGCAYKKHAPRARVLKKIDPDWETELHPRREMRYGRDGYGGF